MERVEIYRTPGRFAGWPANYGMWAWGDELVLGFTVGSHLTEGRFHARDTAKPFVNLQARSLDGGRSWSVADFPGALPGGRGLSADEHMDTGLRLGDILRHEDLPVLKEPLDFTHPDFALICGRTGLLAGTYSFFYYSYDRCRSWGPEITLRAGGGSHDIGYPRTLAAADGTLVTAYYFNDAADRERYIAATRWRP